MAFEAAVDFDTKKEALQVLADKGILTKRDVEVCERALKKTVTEKGMIYHDKFISVSYRGIEEADMLGGKGLRIKLLVENKTKEPINIRARKCVNGIIVDKDDSVSSDLPEKSKAIEIVTLFYSKLSAIDVNKIKDIEEISFIFQTFNTKRIELSKATKYAVITLK